MSRLRIVVVDDHHLFRAGVRSELAAHHEVVGEAATPTEAVAVIAKTSPDVVLLDVHLPEGGGVAVLQALASSETAPKVLALSVSDAAEDVVPMIRAGALGYVTKTIDTAELLAAIATVAAGEASFSPRLAAFVLQAFTAPPAPSAGSASSTATPPPSGRWTSSRTTSGLASAITAIASAGVPASPTTSWWAASSARTPARNRWWSSTTTILIPSPRSAARPRCLRPGSSRSPRSRRPPSCGR